MLPGDCGSCVPPDGSRARTGAAVRAAGPDLSLPGTSEDIALLLAYEQGADLIGRGLSFQHDRFLEKGRQRVCTFLVQLKVGSILVDAKV